MILDSSLQFLASNHIMTTQYTDISLIQLRDVVNTLRMQRTHQCSLLVSNQNMITVSGLLLKSASQDRSGGADTFVI